jgi:hypothetical protein
VVTVQCLCGTEFRTTEKRLAAGRGKFCSRACRYRFATRRSGLKYKIVKVNPTWFTEGPGRGADNPAWRGDAVSYHRLHQWVRDNKPKPDACEHCGATGVRLDWANKSHEYLRDLEDWLALCRTCHWAHDRDDRGSATRRYGAADVQGTGGKL